MHSWELVTDLCTKKCCTIVPAEVAKNFQCCNHRLCYLLCDWQLENYPQKAINVNETWGIGWRSSSPLGWSPGMRLDHGLLKLYRGPEFYFQWPPGFKHSSHFKTSSIWEFLSETTGLSNSLPCRTAGGSGMHRSVPLPTSPARVRERRPPSQQVAGLGGWPVSRCTPSSPPPPPAPSVTLDLRNNSIQRYTGVFKDMQECSRMYKRLHKYINSMQEYPEIFRGWGKSTIYRNTQGGTKSIQGYTNSVHKYTGQSIQECSKVYKSMHGAIIQVDILL